MTCFFGIMSATLPPSVAGRVHFERRESVLYSLQQIGLFLLRRDRHAYLPFRKAHIRDDTLGFFVEVNEVSAVKVKDCRSHFPKGRVRSQNCEDWRKAIKSRGLHR
jgi:hypothetical protein